ncbi:hypothetical protein DDB_G0277795 [Dictyostelium discoideum AX4]|uniref:Uncharacterized protein n=1 Tax=Dictyostelium discoideum TaxID=44689 RepID=Q54Z77_DICDI|nr:hypothetical protein DDB_G0277795 [Dictyostelium discoideum AX4]EAL68571.1 hypothetical protein DDB_G0277795 [Dictyostelium discoideum AX4]|eukprot:XP_642476.1 hypothetical protein DDB_G0277795 [Dictyostelium discoideum AX4]
MTIIESIYSLSPALSPKTGPTNSNLTPINDPLLLSPNPSGLHGGASPNLKACLRNKPLLINFDLNMTTISFNFNGPHCGCN